MSDKHFFELLNEIKGETSKYGGVMKQPEKKFDAWEADFVKWEKRLNDRMGKMERFLNEQASKMERFFE
ncbi:hypothetical protein EQV77_10735 [Halobacillus fulvus]|nr:hypothetical protein EQV77_10735 [Halobacillus fulvus]